MSFKNLCFLATLTIPFFTFSQTYRVKVRTSSGWGVTNLNGDIIINPVYNSCSDFSKDGYVILQNKDKVPEGADTSGKILSLRASNSSIDSYKEFDINGFAEGFLPVKVGDKWGYLDVHKGELRIPAVYREVNEFNEGIAIVSKEKNKQLLIDTLSNEKELAADIEDVKHFREGLAPFKSANGLFGFIDKSGKIAIAPTFDGVGYFHGGLAWARVKESGLIGYIDQTGKWVIKPEFKAGDQYDDITGMVRVKNNGEWFYISKDGTTLKKEDTDYYGDFSDGLAIGRKKGKVGYFDKTGKWVIEPQFKTGFDFQNGYAIVEVDGKYGLINTQGAWVITPKYSAIKSIAKID